MTWSPEDALKQREDALRFLLDREDNRFTKALEWRSPTGLSIPTGVWTLLYNGGLIDWYVIGGNAYRLTTLGWIEACKLLRDEVDLDRRFGALSAHLKGLTKHRAEPWAATHFRTIASETGLPEFWIYDAIDGRMAEIIYCQHGARMASEMGDIEVPAHVGNACGERVGRLR